MGIAERFTSQKIKGGAIVSRILQAEGVQVAFGIGDGTYLGMIASFAEHGIELITPRHETNSVHMAGAYARLTGKVGVAIASNGPGVANALPGVAVEQAEGNRVLLITSCRRAPIVDPDRGGTYQYFPQVNVIGAMAKYSVMVPTADRLAELLRRALRICHTGRPGVVHVDIPETVFNGTFDDDPRWYRDPAGYRSVEPLKPHPSLVERALHMLTKADRPLIHAGSGVIHCGAFEQVRELAHAMGIVITTSWAARAVIDERDELTVPMGYVQAVKRARNEADLVLVLGSRLGETDWWGKAPYWAPPERQELIQVDLDLEHLANNRPVALQVQADVGAFLDALIALHDGQAPESRLKWAKSLRKDCTKRRAKLDKHLGKAMVPMHPAHVAHTCDKVFPDDAILVIDGGNTAIWANFFHEVRSPNTVLTTPKMGMLGAGVSQAIAAKVARPDKEVYCIIGDGAMGFHQQEIETAVRAGLQVTWLVLCDKQWGMVKINQQFALKPVKTLVLGGLSPDETVNTEIGETRFDDLARSMGAHGERVADANGLEGAIRRCRASARPAVIHVDVDPKAHLWAPELRTFKAMHQEPAG